MLLRCIRMVVLQLVLSVKFFDISIHLYSDSKLVGCIRGLANAYPALNKWLSENIAPAGATAFDIARTKCFEQIMWKSKDHDVLGTYFKLQNPLEEDVPAGILREAVMGNEDVGVPGIPLFIVQVC